LTSSKRDDDEDSLDDEFLRYLSGDKSPPIRHPPPPRPPAATTITTKKAVDSMDVDTPSAVATDYYDANDPTCPRPCAPPLELLMEDGYYDESSAISSRSLPTPNMDRRPITNDDVAARPPPPSRVGGRWEMGMVVSEAEGCGRQCIGWWTMMM
jgi:hypothetical protein